MLISQLFDTAPCKKDILLAERMVLGRLSVLTEAEYDRFYEISREIELLEKM